MDPASEQYKPEFHADQTFGKIGGHEVANTPVEPPHPPASKHRVLEADHQI